MKVIPYVPYKSKRAHSIVLVLSKWVIIFLCTVFAAAVILYVVPTWNFIFDTRTDRLFGRSRVEIQNLLGTPASTSKYRNGDETMIYNVDGVYAGIRLRNGKVFQVDHWAK